MHLDQNRMCISLLGKILEEYVLPLKKIDIEIYLFEAIPAIFELFQSTNEICDR